MNVLLVEDSTAISRLVSRIIEDDDHKAFPAASAELGIDVLSNDEIDLILMDVELPGMNGFEATAKIRAEFKHWIPIIFLTSRAEPEYVVKGIDAGGDDYLQKPVVPQVLQAKIRAMARLSNMRQQLNQANDRLARMSLMDSLTNVLNRRAFNKMLDVEWRKSVKQNNPINVAILDIDCFKQYNDFYGHQAGDDCLVKVASSMKSLLEPMKINIARYGGEEFALMLPGISLEESLLIAKKLCQVVFDLGLKHESSKAEPVVTISVGVSGCVSFEGLSGDLLLKQADDALYQAKEGGRNQANLFKPS